MKAGIGLALRAVHTQTACRRGPHHHPKAVMLRISSFFASAPSLKQVWLGADMMKVGIGLALRAVHSHTACRRGPHHHPKAVMLRISSFFVPTPFAQTSLARLWIRCKLGLGSHFVLRIPILLAAGAHTTIQKL